VTVLCDLWLSTLLHREYVKSSLQVGSSRIVVLQESSSLPILQDSISVLIRYSAPSFRIVFLITPPSSAFVPLFPLATTLSTVCLKIPIFQPSLPSRLLISSWCLLAFIIGLFINSTTPQKSESLNQLPCSGSYLRLCFEPERSLAWTLFRGF